MIGSYARAAVQLRPAGRALRRTVRQPAANRGGALHSALRDADRINDRITAVLRAITFLALIVATGSFATAVHDHEVLLSLAGYGLAASLALCFAAVGRAPRALPWLLAVLDSGIVVHCLVAYAKQHGYPITTALAMPGADMIYVYLALAAVQQKRSLVAFTAALFIGAWVGVRVVLDDAPSLFPAEPMLAATPLSETVRLLLIGIVALTLFIAVGRARERVIFALVAQELKSRLSRYVPRTLLTALEEDPDRLNLRESRAAVLLVDIRGFTSFAERRPLPEVVRLLTEFRSLTSKLVDQYGGIVDKFMGDAILALFGSLGQQADSPARAIDCAGAVVQAVDDWNADRRRRGEPPVELAVAVHFGRVMAGVIGDETRVEYTAIGDTVNSAARMLSLCRSIGTPLLVSKDALTAAGRVPSGGWLPLEPELLRGRTRPIDLFVPAQTRPSVAEAVL